MARRPLGPLKIVAMTAVFTTAFWLAVVAWWFQRGDDGDRLAPTRPAAAQSPIAAGEPALIIPVAGVRSEQLVDTFTQARANGMRRHDAIDIMAPRGTPVIAAAPGRVEKLRFSEQGGNTAYIRSASKRRLYYYAHLDGYAPGLTEGAMLAQGAPIGAVGATGNADPLAPHLHFAVSNIAPGETWWAQTTAIDPYPLLHRR